MCVPKSVVCVCVCSGVKVKGCVCVYVVCVGGWVSKGCVFVCTRVFCVCSKDAALCTLGSEEGVMA